MKKIFTLLFCAVAIGFAANATDEVMIDQCINTLLSQDLSTPVRAIDVNLDANHDGVLTIDDVTIFIDMKLEAQMQHINRAPAKNADVNALINEVLETQNDKPNIDNVKEAVDKNIKK
jgi:hypothetical protein